MRNHTADVAIVGGGIAGLWTLRRALDAGYNAVLFEAHSLGCGQTLASQGMIHGGLKYALAGALTGASEAIADMPGRWRDCFSGDGEIDLTAMQPLSDRYYLFAGRSTLGKLTGFFASKTIRGRVQQLDKQHFPSAFRYFDGSVYELGELVVDVPELLHTLAAPVQDRIFRAEMNGANCQPTETGYRLAFEEDVIDVHSLVCCAGAGAEALQKELAVQLPMQRRPLRQVVVRMPLDAPIYAHCLTSITSPEPRLTITTHGTDTLYIGGRLATQGADRTDVQQIAFARRELAECLPWLDFSQAHFETLYIDRAEPRQIGSFRPDEAYAERSGRFIQCWPTKLTLAPDAADKVLDHLPPPAAGGAAPRPALPTAHLGTLPWT